VPLFVPWLLMRTNLKNTIHIQNCTPIGE